MKETRYVIINTSKPGINKIYVICTTVQNVVNYR